MKRIHLGCVALSILLAMPSFATDKLTLQHAEDVALQNHPTLHAAQLNAMAEQQEPRIARSAMLPTLQGNFTGADSQANTRIAAGGLNNPTILERYSNGLTVSQLITDFGRTHHLVQSAEGKAGAANATAKVTRADILLGVDSAFYNTLRAQAVRRVAREAVKERQLLVDQVAALADAKLKSGLDVSFAKVSLGQAQLELTQAENDADAAMAELSTAMGYETPRDFELVDDDAPLQPPPDPQGMVAEALSGRPEVERAQFQLQSAKSFAAAERDLMFPTISAVASGGMTPYGDPLLRSHYGAVGFNLSLPVFTGLQFDARRNEARLKEKAQAENLRGVRNEVARDVHLAWLKADTAYRRLGLTAELLDQSKQALDLAQERYKLGLSSIVELNQAQLAETEAEIQQSSARYDYLVQQATLAYQLGKRP